MPTLRLTTAVFALLLTACLCLEGQSQVQVVNTITVGGQPAGVAADPASNLIFVANRSTNSVNVINGADDTVLTSVLVGPTPTALAINRPQNRLYVANAGNASLSIIDLDSSSPTYLQVVNTISLLNPSFPAITATSLANVRNISFSTDPVNGPRIYVPLITSVGGRLAIVNPTTSPAGLAVIPLPGVSPVTTLVQPLSPSSLRVIIGYATVRTNLTYLALPAGTLSDGPNVGAGQTNLAINLFFNIVFVHRGVTPGTTPTIPASTGTVVADTAVGNGPGDIGAAYAKNYVANAASNTVSVVDTFCWAPGPVPSPGGNCNNPNRWTVLQTVMVGTTPWGVGVNSSTGKIYVANNGSGTVSVLLNATE
jgi:DNA-binding beta-propeller fold protein YncE